MPELSGSRQLGELIDRILLELSDGADPKNEYERALWVAITSHVKKRLLAEMTKTGLIFNCPRLDEDKCMYFSKPAEK